MRNTVLGSFLSPLGLLLASCGSSATGESAQPAPTAAAVTPFTLTEAGSFDEPWAMAFIPGTSYALITEKEGRIKLWQPDGPVRVVTGGPQVAYGGQGGLGDVVLAPDYAASDMVYLSWAEAGEDGSKGAAVGRAKLTLEPEPRLEGLQVIWRQSPKVSGDGHFSHRIVFSPDGQYLFIASGERMKMTPAQDMSGNFGKIVRLRLDGTPAPGNPFAARGSAVTPQIWTLGHRNMLALEFDGQGRLWALEHGPRGGDELNLIKPGQNYGWPVVSNGDHYGGRPIPRHATRPDFAAPAASWNPVIAPGGMIFYSGNQFPEWRGQALIGAMKPAALVRVAIDGESAREVARYPMENRIRAVAQREDGSIWLLEDGRNNPSAKLLRLTPAAR